MAIPDGTQDVIVEGDRCETRITNSCGLIADVYASKGDSEPCATITHVLKVMRTGS
jgi:hypothetical protein